MKICHLCQNQSHCKSNEELCDENKDKFVPNDKVRHFFKRYYIGNDENGDRKYVTHVDLDNPDLQPTHSILVGSRLYCAYCGDRSIHATAGYCCICDGALAEVEYNKELCELEAKHRLEKDELRKKWSGKLRFNIDRLLEVRHSHERSRGSMWGENANHFTTINGNVIKKLEDIL